MIAPAALFLAAKVEEQPRKLEHVIKVAHACLNPQESPLDSRSDVSIDLEDMIMEIMWHIRSVIWCRVGNLLGS